MTFPYGDKYVGEFLDGEFNGQGTYFFSNGEKYIGQYKDGKLNGKASKFDKTSIVFEQGIYEDDVLIKPININPSNSKYSEKNKKQKCLKLGLVDYILYLTPTLVYQGYFKPTQSWTLVYMV